MPQSCCYLFSEECLKLFARRVPHGCWRLTALSIMVSSAFLPHSTHAKSLSWRPDRSHSNDYTVSVTIMSALKPYLTATAHLSHTHTRKQECQSCSPSGRHTASGRDCRESGMGLSWLSIPGATVTDVLFNTRAGSSSGWSEYKLAHCLQQGECCTNVGTKYICKPVLLQLDLIGHSVILMLFHMLFILSNPIEAN